MDHPDGHGPFAYGDRDALDGTGAGVDQAGLRDGAWGRGQRRLRHSAEPRHVGHYTMFESKHWCSVNFFGRFPV